MLGLLWPRVTKTSIDTMEPLYSRHHWEPNPHSEVSPTQGLPVYFQFHKKKNGTPIFGTPVPIILRPIPTPSDSTFDLPPGKLVFLSVSAQMCKRWQRLKRFCTSDVSNVWYQEQWVLILAQKDGTTRKTTCWVDSEIETESDGETVKEECR